MTDRGSPANLQETPILRCRDCKFWNKALRVSMCDVGNVQIEAAQCRRYAPVPDRSGMAKQPWGYWPTVTARDWCGDFQPRDSD